MWSSTSESLVMIHTPDLQSWPSEEGGQKWYFLWIIQSFDYCLQVLRWCRWCRGPRTHNPKGVSLMSPPTTNHSSTIWILNSNCGLRHRCFCSEEKQNKKYDNTLQSYLYIKWSEVYFQNYSLPWSWTDDGSKSHAFANAGNAKVSVLVSSHFFENRKRKQIKA